MLTVPVSPGIWDFTVQVTSYSGPRGSLPLPVAPPLSVGHSGTSRVRVLDQCRSQNKCSLLLSGVGFQLLDPTTDLAATPLIWQRPAGAHSGNTWTSSALPLGYQSCGVGNLMPPAPSETLRLARTGGAGRPAGRGLTGDQSYAVGQVCDGGGVPIGWRTVHLRLSAQLEPRKSVDRLTETGKAVTGLASSIYRVQSVLAQLCAIYRSNEQSLVPSLGTSSWQLTVAGAVQITPQACQELSDRLGPLAGSVTGTLSGLYGSRTASRDQLLQVSSVVSQQQEVWAAILGALGAVPGTGPVYSQLTQSERAVSEAFASVQLRIRQLIPAPTPPPAPEASAFSS